MSEQAAAAEATLDVADFDTLKAEGWTKTARAPTRAEIHADVQGNLARKPYYWQDVEAKEGPQWLCSTDIDELAGWMELARKDRAAAEKAGATFHESPVAAVAAVWVDRTELAKAQRIDAKVR